MKSVAIALFLFSFSAYAFQDGEYICGGNSTDQTTYSYKIKSLNVSGTSLPYLEVTTTSPEESHSIKGIATQFTNTAGSEILVLGNVTLELKAGRPGCRPL